MSLSTFFDVIVFILSSLVTDPSFVSIKDRPEIRKSEVPPSEFRPISGGWGKLGIPNLAGMSLMKSYFILLNDRFIAFTFFELLRENHQGWVKVLPIQISVKKHSKNGHLSKRS